MELRAVAFPGGDVEEMAETIVEEFLKIGLDDDELLGLFRSPVYYTPHAIYREKGEEYVRTLIRKVRGRWGHLRFTEGKQGGKNCLDDLCSPSPGGGSEGTQPQVGSERRKGGGSPPPSAVGGRQGAGTSRRLDATVGRGACPPPSGEGRS